MCRAFFSRGVAAHEGQHIADINKYASNLNILKSQPANRVVLIPTKTLDVIERRETRAEMDYLNNLLSSQNSDGAASINERLSQLDEYYKKHE